MKTEDIVFTEKYRIKDEISRISIGDDKNDSNYKVLSWNPVVRTEGGSR